MSATALIHGKLHGEPAQKTSAKGNAFAMATVRCGDGEGLSWWRIFAFSIEARDELLTLHAGDGIAASGTMKAEVYSKTGEPRVSLSLVADRLMSAKKAKREQASGRREARKAEARQSTSAPPAFDDAVPF